MRVAMAVLRDLSKSARPLANSSKARISCASSLRRCASTAAAAAPIEFPEVEADSGLMAPIVEKGEEAFVDPRKRASRRGRELPHSRYRYHPPKYYRGPLHPIQPPPSSDPVARDFEPGPFNLPRLKQTFHSTIASDILTLAYNHKIPGTPDKPERIRLRPWEGDSPYMANRAKRGPRGAEVLLPLERDITYHNIPEIKAVHVACYMPKAKKNQDHIIVGKAVLQTISGVRPTVTSNKTGVAQFGITKGDKTGVKVTMRGNQAYEFMDKCIHLVFPKIKDWKGIRGKYLCVFIHLSDLRANGVIGTSGDSAGNLSWGLTPSDMLHFPEVEANYSLYPAKMIPGCRIFVETTAKSDRHARMLFGALGIPFYGKLVD